MKIATFLLAAAALVLGYTTPSLATHAKGEVKEIIIRIQTEEGEKFYRVGEDVELLEIRPGARVDFDYSDDDVVESIKPESGEAESKPAMEQ
jgi:hypothetical protein